MKREFKIGDKVIYKITDEYIIKTNRYSSYIKWHNEGTILTILKHDYNTLCVSDGLMEYNLSKRFFTLHESKYKLIKKRTYIQKAK